MPWPARVMGGLLLVVSTTAGCGPLSGDPPGETDATTANGDSSSSAATSTVDGSETGSGDASSTTGPGLPCAWVEGMYEARVPMTMTPSDVSCDADSGTATLRIATEVPRCTGPAAGDRLTIELPPERQAAGEYDLTQLVAQLHMMADIEPIDGQVETGTLIITAVTPTMVVGWAQGDVQGYTFSGSFEAPYCP